MAGKRYHRPAAELRPIVSSRGWCIVSDRILVDGARVGFMSRELPEKRGESGWTFMAGDEDQAFCEDPSRWEACDVNTVANYDIEVVQYLDQPPGSEYVRAHSGKLVRARESTVPEAPVLTIPDAEGPAVLNEHWEAEFPGVFRRRIENENMVAARPGLTFWIQGWSTGDRDPHVVRAKFRAGLGQRAFDVSEDESGELWRLTYRVTEPAPDARRPALTAIVQSGPDVLQLSAYFDDEKDVVSAQAFVRSIRSRQK